MNRLPLKKRKEKPTVACAKVMRYLTVLARKSVAGPKDEHFSRFAPKPNNLDSSKFLSLNLNNFLEFNYFSLTMSHTSTNVYIVNLKCIEYVLLSKVPFQNPVRAVSINLSNILCHRYSFLPVKITIGSTCI